MGATMDLKQCDRLIHRLIYPGYCNCNVINKIGLVTAVFVCVWCDVTIFFLLLTFPIQCCRPAVTPGTPSSPVVCLQNI